MTSARILFPDGLPGGVTLIDDEGEPITQSCFDVENIDDFLYDNTDALPGGKVEGDRLWYVTGQDAELFYTWGFAVLTDLDDDGGDGGL